MTAQKPQLAQYKQTKFLFLRGKYPNVYTIEENSVTVLKTHLIKVKEAKKLLLYESITEVEGHPSLLGIVLWFIGWIFNYKYQLGDVAFSYGGKPYTVKHMRNYKEFINDLNAKLNSRPRR